MSSPSSPSSRAVQELQLLEVRIVASVNARPGLRAVELARLLGVGGLTEVLTTLVDEERVFRTEEGQEARYYPDESQLPVPTVQRDGIALSRGLAKEVAPARGLAKEVAPARGLAKEVAPGIERVVRRRRIVTR